VNRFRLTPLIIICILVARAAPAAATSPIQPANRPTPVAGQENGKLPPQELVSVRADCRVARGAGPSLRLLFAAAQAARINLIGRDCYRVLQDQVAVRQEATTKGNSSCAASVQTTSTGQPRGTSMHGWGKAVDFGDPESLNFSSAGYRFLKANAARYGWNHPGWAEPGGSTCPEAWHWEWVGDGGSMGLDPAPADTVALLPTATGAGYSTVTGLGGLRHHGDAADHGSAEALPLNWVVVGGARSPGGGYWLTAADGGVFAFGDARFAGSTGGIRLNQPVVGMAATPSGQGYWLVAADGGVFAFGDAAWFGSMGGIRLSSPVVGMAATPSGHGYFLVAADGGVFAFGDARFAGSTADIRLNQPVAGLAATPSGAGYWLVASDGGVFAFGDAAFFGSSPRGLDRPPVVGVARTPRGDGYWLTAADGAVQPFGAAAL
jgi:hypothetical protein